MPTPPTNPNYIPTNNFSYSIYASNQALRPSSNISVGQLIEANDNSPVNPGVGWNHVIAYVNAEAARRIPSGNAYAPLGTVSVGAKVNAADFNLVNNYLASLPLPNPAFYYAPTISGASSQGSPPAYHPSEPSQAINPGTQANFSLVPGNLVPNVPVGQLVTAANVNLLIQAIYNAGAVCLCNCNYCTCNCNYCTCNCNYACTCNCNYSDERLKTNIIFSHQEDGINVYTWSYIWDKATTYIGVLAQELLGTKYEAAVFKDSNGFYTVDYSQLPVSMTAV